MCIYGGVDILEDVCVCESVQRSSEPLHEALCVAEVICVSHNVSGGLCGSAIRDVHVFL